MKSTPERKTWRALYFTSYVGQWADREIESGPNFKMAIYGPETLNVLRVALDEAWNNLPRFKQKHRKRKWHLEFLNAQQRANEMRSGFAPQRYSSLQSELF